MFISVYDYVVTEPAETATRSSSMNENPPLDHTEETVEMCALYMDDICQKIPSVILLDGMAPLATPASPSPPFYVVKTELHCY
jgi:hypothetical protein